jgi:hypothetical protein
MPATESRPATERRCGVYASIYASFFFFDACNRKQACNREEVQRVRIYLCGLFATGFKKAKAEG